MSCPYCYDLIDGYCIPIDTPECSKSIQCSPHKIIVSCDYTIPPDIPYVPTYSEGSTCCGYVPKDFINWSYGFGVPTREEPSGTR